MKLVLKLLALLTPYGTYATVLMFVILLACGFGLPLPEDVVLVTAGILTSQGITDMWTTQVVCMAGVLIGDSIVFLLGLTQGYKIKDTPRVKKVLTPKREAKIQYWFQTYGAKIIFLARFMPGLRMPLFFTAGLYKVPFWKFIWLDGMAALISVPLWIWLGHQFGSNLELLESKMKQYQVGTLALLGVVLAILLGLWFFKKRFDRFLERP